MTGKKDILIIDDDISLNELLKDFLKDFGFNITFYTNPLDGLNALKSKPFDFVILDVMMPEMDGFTVLRNIRESGGIPVLMLTARGDVTDRVVGLELGADDYLPKPFEPRELVARINSILKRVSVSEEPEGSSQLASSDTSLKLNTGKKEAELNGDVLPLTTMEYDLLELFVRKKGRILSRDFLMESLKGYEWEVYDRSIDVAVSRLRHKLGDMPSEPRYIKTVRGAGYIFVG